MEPIDEYRTRTYSRFSISKLLLVSELSEFEMLNGCVQGVFLAKAIKRWLIVDQYQWFASGDLC